MDAIANNREIPGFSSTHAVSGRNEWSAGAYIASALPNDAELRESIDDLLRRLSSFYARYAREIMAQRKAIEAGRIEIRPYRSLLSKQRLRNAELLPSELGTVGGEFDIYYGMKELHSREGIAEGRSLIVSPTESYNGTDGWLDFEPVLEPAFITAAQTGSIGESFVQLEPCAVNDDCLVLLPKEDTAVAKLVIVAAIIQAEKWRFHYGRKLTPARIAGFRIPGSKELEEWVGQRLEDTKKVVTASLSPYAGGIATGWYEEAATKA